MGKGRSAAKKSHRGAEGIAASNTNNGGAFSAFDFKDDDFLVEVKDRKAIAKYAKSPSKKPVHRRKSVDKYAFLQCCKSKTRLIIERTIIGDISSNDCYEPCYFAWGVGWVVGFVHCCASVSRWYYWTRDFLGLGNLFFILRSFDFWTTFLCPNNEDTKG